MTISRRTLLASTLAAPLAGLAAIAVSARGADAAQQRPPIRLAFLGDSLTYGLSATSEDRMYRSLLARRILGSEGGRVVATVFQDPFGLTDDAILKLGPLVAARPDIVILEIGNHEAFAPPAELALFDGRYDQLLYELQLTGATIIAGTLFWLNYPAGGLEFRQALAVNQGIRDLCAERGITLADLWTPSLLRPELISRPGEPTAFPDLDGDLLHPNDAGHRVLADAYWDAYRRDLARRRLASLPAGR